MSNRRLYHVTISSLAPQIWQEGLDPERSTGRAKVVWLASEKQLLWAIAHVARKHHCLISELSVFTVKISERRLVKTRWRGVWQCVVTVPPHAEVPARFHIDDYHRGLLRDVYKH